ncbi:MAG TPA: hypothetical protein VKM56_04820 [Verrucomicrobiae bacterium]|nr:hypothetical protein [Verrucomicrobiae bacterium]
MYQRNKRATSIAAFLLAAFQIVADPLDHWTLGNVGAPVVLRAVTYGNGQFVAVGDAGAIFTSPDGAVWTPRQSGTSNTILTICYGKGLFVAGDGNPSSSQADWGVLTSRDGSNWTRTRYPTWGFITSVVFGQNRFVAATRWAAAVSEDGVHWTDLFIPGWASMIGYGQNLFIAASDTTLISTNGIDWTFASGTTRLLQSVTYGNGIFVGTDRNSGTPGDVVTTTNGVWTHWPNTGTIYGFGSVAFAHDTFVLAGDTGVIFTSKTGTNWTERVPGMFYDLGLAYVAYGNGVVMIVGAQGVVLQSDHYGPPIARISKPAALGRSVVRVSVSAEKEKICTLQGSADLENWVDLHSYTNYDGLAEFDEPSGTNATGFYRAVTE